MQKIQKFLSEYKSTFAVFALMAIAVVAFAPHGVALAACPAVPTDCTLTDLVTNGFDTISDSYTEALVTFIPLIIAVVVPISVAMYFLYKGWAWIRRAAR